MAIGEGLLAKALLAKLGIDVFSQLGGIFGGGDGAGGGFLGQVTGAEEEARRATGIGGTLIPQLQAQAAGKPTLATEAQISRMGEEIRKAQQAYATSAQIGGTAGTTPARVHIGGRLEQARLRGIADIMGRGQAGAQQQLGGLYTTGFQALERIELQRRMQRREFAEDVGAIIGGRRAGGAAEGSPSQGLIQQLLAILQGQVPGFGAGAAGGAGAPGWRPQPGFFTPSGGPI